MAKVHWLAILERSRPTYRKRFRIRQWAALHKAFTRIGVYDCLLIKKRRTYSWVLHHIENAAKFVYVRYFFLNDEECRRSGHLDPAIDFQAGQWQNGGHCG